MKISNSITQNHFSQKLSFGDIRYDSSMSQREKVNFEQGPFVSLSAYMNNTQPGFFIEKLANEDNRKCGLYVSRYTDLHRLKDSYNVFVRVDESLLGYDKTTKKIVSRPIDEALSSNDKKLIKMNYIEDEPYYSEYLPLCTIRKYNASQIAKSKKYRVSEDTTAFELRLNEFHQFIDEKKNLIKSFIFSQK